MPAGASPPAIQTSNLCSPARLPWVAVSRIRRIDHGRGQLAQDRQVGCNRSYRPRRVGPAVPFLFLVSWAPNQRRHHRGEAKPALAQPSSPIVLCPPTRPSPHPAPTTLSFDRRHHPSRMPTRRPTHSKGTLMLIGNWRRLDARRSVVRLPARFASGREQQGHTEDRFATEGVSQTCPILARGRSLGSGVALR